LSLIKKLLLWLVTLAVIGGAGWWFFLRKGASAATEDLKPEVVDVKRDNLRVVVQATGQVVANKSVEVKSKASGDIQSLPYDAGDYVHQGDLLVVLDPSVEHRNVLQSESRLLSAQAHLAQAQSQLSLMESDASRILTQASADLRQASAEYENALAQYNRRVGLNQEGVLTAEELDQARTSLAQARSRLQTANASYNDAQNYPLNIELRRQDVVLQQAAVRDAEIALDDAREKFGDTRIIAPATGIISALSVAEGQIIASGISNVGGGTTLMTISDLSRIFVEVQVDETDIGNVEVGQPCDITVDAFPNRPMRGHVDWIAPQGVNQQNVITFAVKVEIDLPHQASSEAVETIDPVMLGGGSPETTSSSASWEDFGLRPNMTANVEIITADLHRVLLIPNEAIQVGDDGKKFVEVVTGDASAEVASSSAQTSRPTGRSRSGFRGSGQGSGQGRSAPGGERRSGASRFAAGGEGGGQRGASRENRAQGSSQPQTGPPTVRREVVLGPSDGVHTQVLEGLAEGDKVLIPIPEWLLEFRQFGNGTPDARTQQRARRMMM
jgi:HlyD family secretion protein